MSEFDFDLLIERKNTASYKWDGCNEDAEVIPMWVADMDFACPPPVVEAVRRRAEHPIYGYPIRTERYYKAIENWFNRRYGYALHREHLAFAPPGVIYGMNTILKLITKKGDRVLIHVPNYDPLFAIVTHNNRTLVTSPLIRDGDRFVIDFEDLKRQAKEGLSALILTSPHNPTGRVWTKEELSKLAEICVQYDIFVLVDEIHADFTAKKCPHTPFGMLGEDLMQKTVVCYSANKGFNLGGLSMSTMIIVNDDLRDRFNVKMNIAQTRLDNVFGMEALIAAYEHGEKWLDAAIDYVEKNKAFVRDYLSSNIPEIRWTETDGTYFGWLDCEGLGLKGEELNQFMLKKAKLALTPGYEFGPGGEAFVRMNLACPKTIVEEAMRRIRQAVKGK
jgi:cystathionine beta-lyase